MKATIIIASSALLLSMSTSLAVNPSTPLAKIDPERGFSRVWALQDKTADVTTFTIDIDPPTFFKGCEYRGGLGAPASFTVSLCATNTDNFKGVTAVLGKFEVDEAKFRISFQVPSEQLLHYHIEFQGWTHTDGNVPLLGNGMYNASLQAISSAPRTVTEADLDTQIEKQKHEAIPGEK